LAIVDGCIYFFFFFQAEDGIRDRTVTGVQTCALPISFQQLQTYKAEVPSLFAPNAVLVVSDGVEARAGTLSAGREWFKPWRTIRSEERRVGKECRARWAADH